MRERSLHPGTFALCTFLLLEMLGGGHSSRDTLLHTNQKRGGGNSEDLKPHYIRKKIYETHPTKKELTLSQSLKGVFCSLGRVSPILEKDPVMNAPSIVFLGGTSLGLFHPQLRILEGKVACSLFCKGTGKNNLYVLHFPVYWLLGPEASCLYLRKDPILWEVWSALSLDHFFSNGHTFSGRKTPGGVTQVRGGGNWNRERGTKPEKKLQGF